MNDKATQTRDIRPIGAAAQGDPRANNREGNPPMWKNPSSLGLVSVDSAIDDIESAALEEARHAAEDRKYRCNPGPILPPNS
jgi:hypothetical protein